MKKLVIAACLIVGVASGPVRASGIPVVDVASIAQQIQQFTQMLKQYRNLQSQLQNMQQQLATAGKQLDAVTGTNNYASMFNSEYWMDWDGVDVGAAVQEYGLSLDTVPLMGSESISDQKQRRRLMARQAKAVDEQINRTTGRFARINDMIAALQTATTAKQVADLQARIAAEQAMLMNTMLKAQLRDKQLQSIRVRRAAMEASEPLGSLLD